MKHSRKKILFSFISIVCGVAISFLAFKSRPISLAYSDAGAPTELEADRLLLEIEEIRRLINGFHNGNELSSEDPLGARLVSRFSQIGLSDIRRWEDDENVYLDIFLQDIDLVTLDTQVIDDYVTLRGHVKKSYRRHAGREGFFQSSFSRTFPVPEGVDRNQMAVVPTKDRVTLRFPKIKV